MNSKSLSSYNASPPSFTPLSQLKSNDTSDAPKKKKHTENDDNTCYGCSDILGEESVGVLCSNYHKLCYVCSQNFINVCLEDPKMILRPKCQRCQTDIFLNTFERQMNQEQQVQYNMFLVKKESMLKNEIVERCPFCNDFQIFPKNHTMVFYICRNDNCGKMSCLVCNKEVEKTASDSCDNFKKIDKTTKKISKDREFHLLKCHPLKDLKLRFENILVDGSIQRCPRCGHGGRKDDQCTHMICGQCQTEWCYICQVEASKLDKDENFVEGMAGHNLNWLEHYPKRCPMVFFDLSQIDRDWPQDDQGCVDLFHRKKTLRLLREFYNDIGSNRYNQLVTTFPGCGKASGFTEYQIKYANIELFRQRRCNIF